MSREDDALKIIGAADGHSAAMGLKVYALSNEKQDARTGEVIYKKAPSVNVVSASCPSLIYFGFMVRYRRHCGGCFGWVVGFDVAIHRLPFGSVLNSQE
jgi:hypothetical protein